MSGGRGWNPNDRLGGLRRFAFAITLFNVLGHVFFGFEQSWLQPFVALGTAYALELLLEYIDSRTSGRAARYRGGPAQFVTFLMSAHISALAVSMLLYCNDRLAVIAFATAVAIASKSMIRLKIGEGKRHVFNPSNLGITVTLLLFPWVGIAPPYQFTENLAGAGDWVLPAIIVVSGSFLNARYTRRLPVLLSWISVFFLQAAVRSAVFQTPFAAALVPMTGVAFLLFTFYMVTDPPTTPLSTRGQIVFGSSVALVYGLLLTLHVVFGFFFALSIVCAVRFALVWWKQDRSPAAAPVSVPAGGAS